MKYPALLYLLFIVNVLNAQNPGTGLKNAGLKGKVKQLVDYIYVNGTETIDTLRPPAKFTKTFNEDGNEIEEHMINSNGSPAGKAEYNYPDGRVIVINAFNGKDSLTTQTVQKYDKKGFETEQTVRYGARGDVLKAEFEYDKKGREIEEDNYSREKLTAKIVATYNEYGQRIETDFYDPDGNIRQKIKRVRDTVKNTLVEASYNAKGVLEKQDTFIYSMPDKQGNWQRMEHTTEAHYNDGKPFIRKTFTKRELVYFE
jgi:hypothetical protein